MARTNRERDAQAARLRAQGWTYQRVADEMGYGTEGGARKATGRALARSYREPMDEARHLELIALDDMARETWGVLERVHYAHSQGRVVRLQKNGPPLVDDAPTLQAIDRLLSIQARRAKLLGLDAPTRHEVWTLDAIDAEIARLRDELGAGSARETRGATGPPG